VKNAEEKESTNQQKSWQEQQERNSEETLPGLLHRYSLT
jgi:hypothetical protein